MRFRLKTWVKLSLTALLLGMALALASRFNNRNTFKEVVVRIDGDEKNGFVNKADILSMVNAYGFSSSVPTKVDNLTLNDLESEIEAMGFVSDCEVSRDLSGNLIVEVVQNQPLARIIRQKGGSIYMAKDGSTMPLSKFYTARVPVITGEGVERIYKKDSLSAEFGKPLYEMLQFIEQNEFWRAQIGQIDVDHQQNITLYMQVGNEAVELGTLDDYESKFEKLKIFYSQIVPFKGWSAYKKIKLGYDQHIVCE
jgi:cell division protein FtsQ